MELARIAIMGDREVRAGGGAMIDRLLDSLACNATSTGQWLIDPLLGGATRLLSLGPYETAARYAEAAARIAAVNSGANCQSGIVGQARVVQARAALGRGDSVRASVLLGQALPALTYGLGARQRRRWARWRGGIRSGGDRGRLRGGSNAAGVHGRTPAGSRISAVADRPTLPAPASCHTTS